MLDFLCGGRSRDEKEENFNFIENVDESEVEGCSDCSVTHGVAESDLIQNQGRVSSEALVS